MAKGEGKFRDVEIRGGRDDGRKTRMEVTKTSKSYVGRLGGREFKLEETADGKLIVDNPK